MTLTERLLEKPGQQCSHIAVAGAGLFAGVGFTQAAKFGESTETAAFRDLKHRNLLIICCRSSRCYQDGISLDPSLVTARFGVAITDYLRERGRLVTDADRLRLIEEVKNEILGLGPLEPLLRDDAISDILVNGASQVYIERSRQAPPYRRAIPRMMTISPQRDRADCGQRGPPRG